MDSEDKQTSNTSPEEYEIKAVIQHLFADFFELACKCNTTYELAMSEEIETKYDISSKIDNLVDEVYAQHSHVPFGPDYDVRLNQIRDYLIDVFDNKLEEYKHELNFRSMIKVKEYK